MRGPTAEDGVRLLFAAFWTGLSIAILLYSIYAYLNTPDIAEFRHFAEPTNTKSEGKISYIFSPTVLVLLGAAFGVSFVIRESKQNADDIDLRKCLFVTLYVLVGSLGAWLNCSRALGAATPADSPPQSSVIPQFR